MLIWVCALHCEAKPVIDYYRLKKSHRDNAFDIYQGDGMVCIVSGIGKLASAAACAWIAACLQDEASLTWINLGTAGAARHPVGSIFLINKIIDADSARCYYPAPTSPARLAAGSCMTLARPGRDYREDCLLDMEASGFASSALRFSSAELVRCIKVVSDNPGEQCGNDRQRVSDLIQRHIGSIDREAAELDALNREIAGLEVSAESWQQLTAMAHFTQTQQSRARVLLRYLSNRDFSDEWLLQELATQKSASAMILKLEQISFGDSETL